VDVGSHPLGQQRRGGRVVQMPAQAAGRHVPQPEQGARLMTPNPRLVSTALLARVGDDGHGRLLLDSQRAAGVDTAGVLVGDISSHIESIARKGNQVTVLVNLSSLTS